MIAVQEVSFQKLLELHKFYNDYPLAPEKLETKREKQIN